MGSFPYFIKKIPKEATYGRKFYLALAWGVMVPGREGHAAEWLLAVVAAEATCSRLGRSGTEMGWKMQLSLFWKES